MTEKQHVRTSGRVHELPRATSTVRPRTSIDTASMLPTPRRIERPVSVVKARDHNRGPGGQLPVVTDVTTSPVVQSTDDARRAPLYSWQITAEVDRVIKDVPQTSSALRRSGVTTANPAGLSTEPSQKG